MNDPSDLPFPSGVQKVLAILASSRITYRIENLQAPAHRASEAAELLGCPLGAVVKSLIFQTETTGEMILVLVSGKNRADPQRLQKYFNQMTKPVSPASVLAFTGYPVGAVPPFGFLGDNAPLIDADLMSYDFVWASAGAADVLVKISSADLLRLTDGRVVIIKTLEK